MKVRRRPAIDEYVEDDQAVVFVDGRVVTLSLLATAALISVGADWTEADSVAAELVARFGEPPQGSDPAVMTRTTLESLVAIGLLDVQSAV